MKCPWPYCEDEAVSKTITYISKTDGKTYTTKSMCQIHYDDNLKYLREQNRVVGVK